MATPWVCSGFAHGSEPNIFQRLPATASSGADGFGLSAVVVGFGSSALAVQNDREISHDLRVANELEPKVLHIGDSLGTGVPGLLIAGVEYYINPRDGLSHFDALVYTFLNTSVLKVATDRKRPRGSNHSYPSSHSSTAFATATHLAYRYGWKAGVPSYLLASFVAYERMIDQWHWASDVLAGATLGFFWGRASYNYHFGKNEQTWVPVITPRYVGATWFF